jgi:hypothetical protein
MLVALFGFTMLCIAACTTQPDTKGSSKPGEVANNPADLAGNQQVKAPPGQEKSELPRLFPDDPSMFPKDANELAGGKIKFIFDESKVPYIDVDHWNKGRQFLTAQHRVFGTGAHSGSEVTLTLHGASYKGNTAYKLTYAIPDKLHFLESHFYEFSAGLNRHVPTLPRQVDARGGHKLSWFVCFGDNCKPREGESLEETARRSEYAIVVIFGQQEKEKQ